MPFNKFTPLKEVAGQDLKYGLIDNSQTIANGEAIIPGVQGDTAVVLTGGGTTGALLGVVHSLVGKDGKVLELNSKAVASDNVTVAQIQASFIPNFIPYEFGATLDADNETTDNSGAYGNFAVDSTGLLLDEDTYTAFTTVIAKQFFSFGLVPGTTRDVTGYFIKKIGFTA